MPIRNFPFTVPELRKHPRPRLPIKIISPENGVVIPHWAIIDTGADHCCIPAKYAEILGHNLEKGEKQIFNVVGGEGKGYLHRTHLKICDFNTDDILHSIRNIQACYIENFDVVLLGVNTFLKDFILKINYPEKRFSLRLPAKKK